VEFTRFVSERSCLFQRLPELGVILKFASLLSIFLPEVSNTVYKLALLFRAYNLGLLPKLKLVNFALELAQRKPPATLNLLLI